VPPEREVCLDPLLERLETKRLDPRDLDLRELLVGELGQRAPAKQPKRLAQNRGRLERLLCRRLGEQRLEPLQVESAGWEDERVAGRTGLQDLVAHHLPQLPDVDLQRLDRPLRGALAPERIDQLVDGNDLVRAQQQRREQHPLLAATKRQRPPVQKRFDGPKDPELHADHREHLSPAALEQPRV
jgi:hypothetical protein